VLQCVGSVLQCVVMCCSVWNKMLGEPVHGYVRPNKTLGMRVCCSVLQCVAVCCSVCCIVLTVCCSVLQCVAVYGSVLQFVAVAA